MIDHLVFVFIVRHSREPVYCSPFSWFAMIIIVFQLQTCGFDKETDTMASIYTQAFANPENISEPQTGIEPATF